MPSINDRKTREQRKLEAEGRQAAYRKLSTADRVAALDKRLGASKGATLERVRLNIAEGEAELAAGGPAVKLLEEIFTEPAAAPKKRTSRGARGKK